MTDLAELTLIIRSEAAKEAKRVLDDLQKSSDRAEKSTKSLESTSSSLEKTMLRLAAAAGGFAAVSKTIGLSNEFEDAQVSLGYLLKDFEKAKILLGSLEQLGLDTPFSRRTYEQAAQGLIGMGFQAEKVVETLGAAADAAAALGTGEQGVQSIARALAMISARGELAGRGLQQLAAANIPVFKMLADAIGVSIDQAKDFAEKGMINADTATTIILNGLKSKYAGAAAALDSTTRGMLNDVKDAAEIAARDLGDSLKEAFFDKQMLVDLVATVREIGHVAGDAIRILSGGAPKFAETSTQAHLLAAALQLILGILTSIIALKLISWLVSLGSALITAVQYFRAFGVEALTLLPVLGPTGWLAIGIGAVVGVLPSLVRWLSSSSVEMERVERTSSSLKGAVDSLSQSLLKLRIDSTWGSGGDRARGLATTLDSLKVIQQSLVQTQESIARGAGGNTAISVFKDAFSALRDIDKTVKLPEFTRAVEDFGKSLGEWGQPYGDMAEGRLRSIAAAVKVLEEELRKLQATSNGTDPGLAALRGSVPTASGTFEQLMRQITLKGMESANPAFAAANSAENALRSAFKDGGLGAPSPEMISQVRVYITELNEMIDRQKAAVEAAKESDEALKAYNKSYEDAATTVSEWIKNKQFEIKLLQEEDPVKRKAMELQRELMSSLNGIEPENLWEALAAIQGIAETLVDLESKVGPDGVDLLGEMARPFQDLQDQLEGLDFERSLIGKSADDQDVLRSVREAQIRFREAGIEMDKTEIDMLERKIRENQQLQREYDKLKTIADGVGDAFADFVDGMISGSKSASESLADLARALERIILQQLVLAPLAGAISSGITNIFAPGSKSALGNVFAGGRVTPFAAGGVVSSTTYFPMRGGVGMMGENGPEAIMPLGRDANGRLGVHGGGGPTVVFNIKTNDASSFGKTQFQLMSQAQRMMRR